MNRKTLISFLILLLTLSLVGCVRSNKRSLEKHLELITKRVEDRYMKDQEKYTSFSLYPLYDQYDKVNYFLVEFEPFDYIYITINTIFIPNLSNLSDYGISSATSWEDSEGQRHEQSHFKVRNIENEKRYLLLITIDGSPRRTPAVKRGDLYVSLTSMETFDVNDANTTNNLFRPYVPFHPKPDFNL
ncbi:MAG: hypothetical protein WC939_01910 [Acholeplasmataceae bacterium]